MSGTAKYLVDRNLGRLCTWLRAMGLDATFAGPEDDGTIIREALAEGRTLVTKDRKLAERRVVTGGQLRLVVIRADLLWDQIAEFTGAVPIDGSRFFTRCVRCNVELVPETKAGVRDEVPPYVYDHHDAFSRCPSCRRLYWQGTHWEHMRTKIQEASHA